MTDMGDDGADEVKVFRKNDADELAAESMHASAQLHEDKQDVAFEAEMETQSQNSQKSSIAFPFQSPLGPLSPAVSAWMSPYASPAYNFMLSPGYLLSNMFRMQQMAAMASSVPQLDAKPTTSSAAHAGHHHAGNGAGGPMTTPKRRKEARDLKKEQHIKKPLNAFMWFMKENRQKILSVDGNASKQSAELNTILGKMWHDLSKEEQQKYYEKAKEERENHAKLYPNWSARENYAVHKKKRKKREKSVENLESKKCRARFGVNNQDQWCKHCKRKKRCLLVRDSESPHHGNGSTTPHTNPTTPHTIGSPASHFSHASSSMASDEDDVRDVKPLGLGLGLGMGHRTPPPNALAAAAAAAAASGTPGALMPSMNPMLNFTAMSPSFPMFNFGHFAATSPFAASSMMGTPGPFGTPTASGGMSVSAAATPTLHPLN